MSYTLGLDIGSASIGWALVDEEGKQIINAGVRVFPEGVDRDQKGGEKSKSQARREARGMRRQLARRAARKRTLRHTLRDSGLWPENEVDAAALIALDPYGLRRRALTDRLSPHEIGRILIHLNQRRGFLSNRKTDRAKKKENSEMLAQISELAGKIEAAGHRTLGEHLASERSNDPLQRVRGRHTRRDMAQSEFEAIWQAQCVHHPALLTEDLKKTLNDPTPDENWIHKGLIFGQRRMYWPKSVVGQCELEPKHKRSPRADRAAQRFRLLQEVNNLRLLDTTTGEERPLSADERSRLLAWLERKKEAKFDDIRKHLGLYEQVRFNLERGERTKLHGMPTDAVLAHKDRFGKKWFTMPGEERDAIVRRLLDGDDGDIRQKAAEWGVDTDALLEVNLEDGYSSYSRLAIEKLLPFMERGLPLTAADDRPCALRAAGYIRPWEKVVNQRDALSRPPEVTNPLVRQALFEVRKVVNAIVREYGKPAKIHIELAREVRGTAKQRAQMSKDNWDRKRERDAAAEWIRERGVKPTKETIDQYLLWREQGELCLYSGRPISPNQLFGGDVSVDHILPRYRSLDNSLMNRVVCFRDENVAKGDRTPYEWLAEADPKKYDDLLQRGRDLPYPKLLKLRQQTVELDDFVARQLNDTAYITSQVHQYIRCLGAPVVCTKGQLTADLRWKWGLDTVLRHDDVKMKNRDDHRHHAVDAVVIALMDHARLQQLAKMYRQEGTRSDELPPPWESFREDAERTIKAINVSHRVRRKVRGALHEETIYGGTQKRADGTVPGTARPWAKNWVEASDRFVYRKPVDQLTPAMIDDIRDETIRTIVIQRLAKFGIAPGEKRKIPAEVWKEPLTMPSGVVIKKVRLLKKDQTIRSLRNGIAHVKPGSTHHCSFFEMTDGNGKQKRVARFVPMIEAARRVQNRESLYLRDDPGYPAAKFLMSISPGDAMLARFDGQEKLLILRTAISTESKFLFVEHTDARQDKEVKKYRASVNTLDGRRVIIDVLGRIRNAHD